MSASPAVRQVAVRGGVATWSELRPAVTRRQLHQALSDRSLVRLRRGAYALPTAEMHRAAAARVGGVLVGRSAAVAWRMRVKTEPGVPEVAVGRGRKLTVDQRRNISVCWRPLRESQVDAAMGATTPLQTVIDCARTLPFDEALCIADSALRTRRVTSRELLRAAQATRGPGRLRAQRVALAADARSVNPFESVLRAISLDVPGLMLVPQLELQLPGSIIHPDLADPVLGIVVEADSYEFHTSAFQIKSDCRRYTALSLDGWLVLRVCYEDAMHQQEVVREWFAAAVERRQRQSFLPLTG